LAPDALLEGLCPAGGDAENIKYEDDISDANELSDADHSSETDAADDVSCNHDGAASVAETTLTGRVFKISRAEASSKHLASRLQRIATIGASEHWLVSTDHVQLLPDSVLGVGSYGIVVQGLVHGTRVALKLPHLANDSYHGRALRTLVNELCVLRHVRHPNCVALHGACMDVQNSALALVFEFVQGKTLESIVASTGLPPTPSNRLGILLDVCCALRHLHALSPQIVHGDLKPANALWGCALSCFAC